MREFCLNYPLLDEFWRDREPGIAMKYMENGLLSDVIARVKIGKTRHFWTPTGIEVVICGFAPGIELNHSKDCVHRNLKPENLLQGVQPTP
jgi:serine/threonine protein kinase